MARQLPNRWPQSQSMTMEISRDIVTARDPLKEVLSPTTSVQFPQWNPCNINYVLEDNAEWSYIYNSFICNMFISLLFIRYIDLFPHFSFYFRWKPPTTFAAMPKFRHSGLPKRPRRSSSTARKAFGPMQILPSKSLHTPKVSRPISIHRSIRVHRYDKQLFISSN